MRLNQTQFALPGKKKNNRTKIEGQCRPQKVLVMRRDEPFLRSTPRRIPARGLRHGLCIPAKRLARVNLGPDLLTKQDKAPEPNLPTCACQEGTPPPTEGLHVPALREATCAAWVQPPTHSVRVQHSPTRSSRVRTRLGPRGGTQGGRKQILHCEIKH